jgi:AcrR family transcriptional regulator
VNARHESPEIRRQQFFHAALEVCAEKGFHATRMEDIAARAGLSKGSLYHHFDSKEQLFLQLVDAVSGEAEQLLDREMSQQVSAAEALLHMYDHFVDHFTAQPQAMSGLLEFVVLAVRNDDFGRRLRERYGVAVEKTTELIAYGKERGEFAADLDAEQAGRIVALSCDGLAMMYHAIGWDDRMKADGREQLRCLLRAFTAPATDPKK